MNKKFNLMLSCASLLVTAALLVLTVFSWYVVNKQVSVTGIVGSTGDKNLNFTLRYWDGDSWEDVTTDLVFDGWLPGKTTYYELMVENTGDDDITVNADFIGVESRVNSDYVKATYDGETGGYITYNGVNAYKYTGNPEGSNPAYVRVDTIDSPNQALYKIMETTTGGKKDYAVSVGTLKIENGFRWQYIGESENSANETLHTGAITDIDDITENDYVYDISTPLLQNYEVFGDTSIYYYFAITFLDDDDMDSFYMYQELFIEAIMISN